MVPVGQFVTDEEAEVKTEDRDFPSSPLGGTLCSQCRGFRVQFLVGELDPGCFN